MNKFDATKEVYVLSNGNFCVFIKSDNTLIKTDTATTKKVEKNATTSTQKNTESAATDLV